MTTPRLDATHDPARRSWVPSANEAGADLFVSLHLNASRARGAKGSEVYFLSLGEGDVDAETLAAENGPEPSEKPADPEGLVAGILEDPATALLY